MSSQPGRTEELLAFLRNLRAVREFKPDPVEPEVLLEILETGRWTGSAKNVQPWQVLVVQRRETLAQLATHGLFAQHVAGAAAALAILVQPDGGPFDEGRLAQNLMLGAAALGVGSCIGSLFPAPEQEAAKRLLGVPDEIKVRTVISLGYPTRTLADSAGAVRQALPWGRKPMPEFASWERFDQRTPPAN